MAPPAPPATRTTLRTLLAFVAMLAGVALTIMLGNWQSRRAAEKIAMETAWEAAQQARPVQLRTPDDVSSVARQVPRRIVVRGTFEHAHTVWLDNRPMGGRSGFLVITPLRMEGTDMRLLVNRGWAPRDPADRTHLPPIGQPEGAVELTGMAVQDVPRLFQFSGGETGTIRQNLDIDQLRVAIGAPIAPFVLQQTTDLDDKLDRHWTPPATGVDKHRGYAFQWYSLAALLGMIMIGLAWRVLRARAALRGGA